MEWWPKRDETGDPNEELPCILACGHRIQHVCQRLFNPREGHQRGIGGFRLGAGARVERRETEHGREGKPRHLSRPPRSAQPRPDAVDQAGGAWIFFRLRPNSGRVCEQLQPRAPATPAHVEPPRVLPDGHRLGGTY
jgi:hypothetical protein